MSSAVVGQWAALPNSTGAGGAAVDAYSGYVFDDDLGLWIAGAGGHQDSSDNRVVKYDASVDVPTGWVVKKASSTVVQSNVPYYSDGLPVSTHTYDYTFWSATLRRIIRFGAFGIYSTGFGSNTIDGFNVDTNQWDPAGTYPYTNGGSSWDNNPHNYGAFQDKNTGTILWADGGSVKTWVPGQSSFGDKGTTVGIVRFPQCWDALRSANFGLAWGDGQDSGSGVTAVHTATPSGTPVKRTITFNSSAAYTQFMSSTPAYAGMDYDIIRDKFMFVCGASGGITGAPRIFEITPNSGTVWDMAIYTPAGGDPGTISSNGVNGRFKYVRKGSVGGFVFMSKSSSGLYFLRTS
jgi:hypothetical protein